MNFAPSSEDDEVQDETVLASAGQMPCVIGTSTGDHIVPANDHQPSSGDEDAVSGEVHNPAPSSAASEDFEDGITAGRPGYLRGDTSVVVASTITGAGTVAAMHGQRPQKFGFPFRSIVMKIASNVILLAVLLAVVINNSTVRLPKLLDQFLEVLGQPYSVLFFFLIGLNMLWSVIKHHIRLVVFILLARTLFCGIFAAILWIGPILPQRASRQAAVFALCCPMSGVSMSYCIDFGYNRSLHAAVQTSSNVLSLIMLWALLNLS